VIPKSSSRRPLSTVAIDEHANAIKHESATSNKSEALAGLTIGIKDNIVTQSHPTTAASRALSGYTSPFDATVIKLLRSHGASLLPGLNMDEFGMGSHSQNSHHGPVLSPFRRDDISLSPGGSSGGSAVAVARGDCWAALGTDTGGSVRLPAAYTGIVGFKPSYGRVSRWGVIPYANSLDTVGILAKKTEDARKIFRCLDAYDKNDPTSLSPSVRSRLDSSTTSQLEKPPRPLRIGIPLEYNLTEISPAVRATYTHTLALLQRAGHTLHPINLPTTRLALSAYYVLAPAEASSNLAKYDGIRYGHRSASDDPSSSSSPSSPSLSSTSPTSTSPTLSSSSSPQLYARTRAEAFGKEVRRRILLGTYSLSAGAQENFFRQAQRVRRLVQREFDGVFAEKNPLLDSAVSSNFDSRSSHSDGERSGEEESGPSTEVKVDVLLAPTAPTLPPTVVELLGRSPVEAYVNDVFTVPASLAGLPAVSVPVPLVRAKADGDGDTDAAAAAADAEAEFARREDVTTVGLQVVGQFGQDEMVLRVAEMVEGIVGSEAKMEP
jgi:aspartyl-tRNA(Asn)/glutamyl-tRNA(Gln) amidotransferase subunit A